MSTTTAGPSSPPQPPGHRKQPSLADTLALTAITDPAFNANLPQLTTSLTAPLMHRLQAPPSYPIASTLALTATFDPFPGLAAQHSIGSTQAQISPTSGTERMKYQPTQVSLDYSIRSAAGEDEQETPSDILHYYQSSAEARKQILIQSISVVRLMSRAWSLFHTVAKDKAMKAKLIRPRDHHHTGSGARHSTLAASFMSMVQAQQEQQQQQAALESQMSENSLAEADEDVDDEDALELPSDERKYTRSVTPSTASATTAKPPDRTQSRALGASEMERAVQTAHQTKLLREAEESERVRAETEEQRSQQQIAFQQQKMEQEAATTQQQGESPYIHLQEENKQIPHVPLRVGIIGCGSLGSQIATKILEEFCDLPPETRSNALGEGASKTGQPAPPPVPTTQNGLRLFISTRRPDHPQIVRLVKRSGGTIGTMGTHTNSGLVTVYFDNARLMTECNVVLICTLPHQVQLLSSVLRSISQSHQPRSQLFFSITSSHTIKSLKHLLGSHLCLARTSLVLPHLLLKDSEPSHDAMKEFIDQVMSSSIKSFTFQSSYRTILGEEGIQRLMDGFRRDLEREVSSCFCKEVKPTTQVIPTKTFGRPNVSSSTAAAGRPSSRESPPTSSSIRSTPAVSLGLTSPSLIQTPGGHVLPKLSDLKQSDETKESRFVATASKSSSTSSSPQAHQPFQRIVITSSNDNPRERIIPYPVITQPSTAQRMK